MKITNKYELPETLLNLYHKQRREYAQTKGKADMSVTQLIRSPRIDLLTSAHYHEMTDDVADRLWAILGTVIHRIMEEGADEEHIAEENLFAKVKGWTIKGGTDVKKLGNRVGIIDYKFTKAFKYEKGEFLDWEEQLNLYAYLLRVSQGVYVDFLQVVMFVRDFTPALAKTRKGYPPASAVPVDIKLWTEAEQKAFLLKKIDEHQEARRAHEWGEPLPLCTERDRWKHPGAWIVMKKGGKRASRVFGSDDAGKASAAEWLDDQAKKGDYEVQKRDTPPTRCVGNYCGVNQWCDQWAKDKVNWPEANNEGT